MARWDPFNGLSESEMEDLRKEVDQAFDRFGLPMARTSRTAFLPGYGARAYPLINLYEDQNTLYLETLAPGADPASFNISIVGDTLTLSGEKRRAAGEVKPEAFHREERAAGKFVRSIDLPLEVDDNNNPKAEYKNGLLLLTLAKSEKAKPKQITVQVA
jgi:HSP20 family protein